MDIFAIKDAAGANRPSVSPALSIPRGNGAEMRKAAEAFEAQFLGQMFQLSMRDMPVDDVFGGGPGERMFKDFLTDAWAENASKSNQVGIADAVMKTLIEAQGAAQK